MKKFLLSVGAEMKQVAWPTRSKVITFTLVIVVVSLVVAYILGAFDALFGYGLRTLILK
jgi:preprotein translocase subunit SecE